jgi:hypothetical protein
MDASLTRIADVIGADVTVAAVSVYRQVNDLAQPLIALIDGAIDSIVQYRFHSP